MGWGATADGLVQWLPKRARLEVIEDTGHFIHIERPQETAQLVLEFLKS